MYFTIFRDLGNGKESILTFKAVMKGMCGFFDENDASAARISLTYESAKGDCLIESFEVKRDNITDFSFYAEDPAEFAIYADTLNKFIQAICKCYNKPEQVKADHHWHVHKEDVKPEPDIITNDPNCTGSTILDQIVTDAINSTDLNKKAPEAESILNELHDPLKTTIIEPILMPEDQELITRIIETEELFEPVYIEKEVEIKEEPKKEPKPVDVLNPH